MFFVPDAPTLGEFYLDSESRSESRPRGNMKEKLNFSRITITLSQTYAILGAFYLYKTDLIMVQSALIRA